MPFILIPGLARQHDIENMDIALLFTVLGASNTLGRLAAGALGGKKFVDPLIINNAALLVAGVATVMVVHSPHYSLFVLYSAVFGLCIGKFTLTIDLNLIPSHGKSTFQNLMIDPSCVRINGCYGSE